MKFGVALATLGLVAQGSAFVPSFNARQSFVGQTVAHAAAPASTRHTRQVLKAVAAAPAVETEVLTRVSGGRPIGCTGGCPVVVPVSVRVFHLHARSLRNNDEDFLHMK